VRPRAIVMSLWVIACAATCAVPVLGADHRNANGEQPAPESTPSPSPSPSPSPTAEPFGFGTGFIPASPQELQQLGIADAPLYAAANLPRAADLTVHFPAPDVHGQGTQNSCVAWASSYALRSYEEVLRRHWTANGTDHIFSPAFIYNAINNGEDNGAPMKPALQRLYQVGDVPLSVMPWSENDYLSTPAPSATRIAPLYKINAFKPVGHSTYTLKSYLANNIPVIIGFYVDDSFGNPMKNTDRAWERLDDISDSGHKHAVVLIGYDDDKALQSGGAGAFKVINSYGKNWGTNGYGWISYATLQKQIIEAWVVTVNMSGYGLSESGTVSIGGASLAQAITFALNRNVHYDLVTNGFGDETEFSGTIQAPANAVGNVQVIVRIYYEAPDHGIGQSVIATEFPEMEMPDGYLAVSSGLIPIPSEGLVNKSWYVLLPSAAIQVDHPPGQPQQLYHFVAVPELYVDDLQLAKGNPIHFRLFL